MSEVMRESLTMAKTLRSKHVRAEHMLLAILKQNNSFTHSVMEKFDADLQTIKDTLVRAITEVINRADANSNESIVTEPDAAPVLDAQASSILRMADLEARMNHDKTVDVKHLMLALLHDGINSTAKDILEKNNICYDEVLNIANEKDDNAPALESGVTKPVSGIDLGEDEEDEGGYAVSNGKSASSDAKGTKTKTEKKTPLIDNFTTDLTAAAREKKLDAVVGREKEIQRVTEILCRRKKNNPILIGDPGVGKSAIVEGLAQRIVNNETSPILFNKRIVSLDLASMVAGTKYRGQFEERIKILVNELKNNPDIIVFIDEIHTIIGAGSAAGTMDAANMLKPELARGEIQCIGATTVDEFRKSIEKDGALDRRFQKVMVEPTTAEETLQILNNIKGRYEEHHHVRYSDEAIKACVDLTQRYVTDRAFPDKAIDALDEVGAKIHLRHTDIPASITQKRKDIEAMDEKKIEAIKSQNFELAANYRDSIVSMKKELEDMTHEWEKNENVSVTEVTGTDVADVVSVMTGIPVQRVAENENQRLRTLAGVLKESVVAQDRAIDKMVKAIKRNRVGIRDRRHPIGVFMFLGPTGVGKTHLTKKLAEHMFGSEDSLIRIDMSEYSESFNSSRLVGAPPGYVGYEEGGQLTERVRRKPYSIVLLDEIEKANANIFNLLLQVLDEGRLTDGNGRLVDFRNTIVIMTSNVGTRQLKEFAHGIGFNSGNGMAADMNEKDKEYARSIIQKSLSKQFAPEFLNRLDDIITFDQLDFNAIRKITDIELRSLYKRIEDMGYTLTIDEDAKDFIATKGYDIQFGARPLKRALQTYVEDIACERILEGEVSEGDNIHIKKEDLV